MIVEFYCYDQNPSRFCFLKQIRAFVKPTDEREHAFFSARFSGIHFFGKDGKTTVKVGFHALTAVNVFLVSQLQLNAETL